MSIVKSPTMPDCQYGPLAGPACRSSHHWVNGMSKPIGQKIALGFAVLSYIGAIVCVLGAVFYTDKDPNDAVRAALMASVVFFVGCGVVLQVIGTARLKGLLSGSGEYDPD